MIFCFNFMVFAELEAKKQETERDTDIYSAI